MTPPHRVIIHGESPDPAPLRLLADDLRRFEWQPLGVIGPAETAHAFATVWISMAGGKFRLLRHERVYELRRVTHPTGVPGRLRVATEADIALVAEWLQAFHQELDMEFNVERSIEHARQRIDQRVIYLWDHDAPVSLAGRPRHTAHGMSIGPVYTPPEFRRRGYAGACVAVLSQQMLDAGWEFCVLFTDLANPTSNSVYQKIGYRPVCDFDELVFE
jgi:predicted GNAT family acetyltransferase